MQQYLQVSFQIPTYTVIRTERTGLKRELKKETVFENLNKSSKWQKSTNKIKFDIRLTLA